METKVPGVEASTMLGHGLPIEWYGYSRKIKKENHKVVVVIGDETDEGSIWESVSNVSFKT